LYVFYVKDNKAGFDLKYASKLFGVFQRLKEEFEDTRLGLSLFTGTFVNMTGIFWVDTSGK
jgi:light-regulated signal transduction histidine kinase (bacteriophytochrome)